MKAPKNTVSKEPVGIVISVKSNADLPTVFSAYVWGPAPADDAPPRAA